jgi:hypothetical protein
MGPDRPSVRLVLLDLADLRGLVVQLRRVGRRAQRVPVHQPRPADLEDRPALAGQAGRLRHAHRRRLADRRDLAGLVRLEVRPDPPDLGGRLRQTGQVDLAAPCKPPMRSSRWQQEVSQPVASAFHLSERRNLRSHVHCGQAATIRDCFTHRAVATYSRRQASPA